jgi:hypothetical protein
MRIGTGIPVGVHGLAPPGIEDAADEHGDGDHDTDRHLNQCVRRT